MRLQVFQSGKGDCLLLSNARDTARILVDGGMPAAYRDHVGPALGKLRDARKKIDLVYVSHIDQDHIGGVLRMLDDEVAWRVHDFQIKNGNASHRAPEVPRPPVIGAIWHNAFHEQITKNRGKIEKALAAAGAVLSGADVAKLREAGLDQSELATSIAEAIKVSRRIGAKQLDIPLNAPARGKLMMVRPRQRATSLGGMRITIIGPVPKHLTALRKEWNSWLSKNEKALDKIRKAAGRDEDRLGASALDLLNARFALEVEAFGDPSKVTTPNLASLTLLVEERGQSILLTGDARGDQIVEGLKQVKRPLPIRVDVLKVPHHGSENNVDPPFCDAVVARHYVFCGNGQHENPDLRVVELIAERRMAATGPFKFWFNSSGAVSDKAPAHMRKVEKLVKRLARASRGRMKFRFLTRGSSMRVLAR